MEIAIFSKDFTPYTTDSTIGDYLASLAGEFVELGHNVSLFLPMPMGLDVASHSLARRLVSLSVTLDGTDYECFRYDGRTTSGVQAYLVEIEGVPLHKETLDARVPVWEIYVRSAAEILMSLDLEPDWCLTLDEPIASHADVLRRPPYQLSTKHMHLSVEDASGSVDLKKVLKQADSIVTTNIFPDASAGTAPDSELGELIANGKVTVLPVPVSTGEPLTPEDKISCKTTFQIRHGLPVRPNVPIVLFSDRVANETQQLLQSFLKSDVQAIALKGDDSLQSLAEKYPDRLVLIDSEQEPDALPSADGYVVGDDSSLANMALSQGTVPIGGPGIANNIVDLEPSCRSGSGILLDDLSFPSLRNGLERLTTACAHEADFRALSNRIQSYVPSWTDVARYYIQLMSS